MSFHPPPQSTMVPPPLHVGPQGNLMPGYLPSAALAAGLPPPPMPPPFPAFSVPPPGQPAIQPTLIPNSSTHQKMQPPRPQYHGRKPNELYDKRRDQFRPVSSSDKPTVTVFVGNITEHASDALIRQLLMKCGIVVNWKRVQGADGKLQAFGFCEYIDPEAGLRAIRLLHDLSVGDKNLVVKVDAKTKAMLEEYKKNKATQQRGSNSWNEENKNGEEELDEATLSQDSDVRKNITGLLTDNADVLSGKFKGTTNKWRASHSGSEENLEGMGMDKDKKHLISREIRFFRDAYKDSEKEKKDRGKEDKEYEKDKKETRDNERDRDRDRGKERPRDRSQERDYERSRSNERSRDRSRSKDRDRGREDRDKGREDRDRGRQNRDRELDEDEQYEKRKRERKQKERNQAFVERLKAWEGRERKKLRDYDREMEKDRELENEQAREKKHLLEFLEDYDDEQDDPKYYRGGSFDRRLQARLLEMESDDKDRKRELEEIEEIRKRLGEEAVVDHEEEEAMEEEPAVEVDPEPRPTLQATFKPAVHVVEAAPNIPSPAYESPKNSPKVNVVNKTKPQQEESVDNMDSETATKKTFIFEMKTKTAVGSSNSNRKKLEAVFNSEEDTTANKGSKRKLVPLDYSEEEMNAVGNAAAKNAEDKKKSIKSLIERIPTAKVELFAYSLDWDCVDQILIDRRIRPWVNKKIVEYIGEEEPSLVDFMCSKLLARSQPENILRDVSMVLDDEAEVFVVKMWRLLIYETEAKKIGLVK